MADTGLGGALNSHMVEAESRATSEIKKKFLCSVSEGVVTCKSRLVPKGRRVAGMGSELSNEARVARALWSFSIFERRNLREKP